MMLVAPSLLRRDCNQTNNLGVVTVIFIRRSSSLKSGLLLAMQIDRHWSEGDYLQSTVSSRRTPLLAGFFIFSQYGDRPDR